MKERDLYGHALSSTAFYICLYGGKEMDDFKNRFLRGSRTWTDILPLTLLLGYGWMFIGTILSIIIKAGNWGYLFSDDPDIVAFMGVYSAFTGIWVVTIGAAFIFKGNRPMLKEIVPDKKSKIFLGFLIGLVAGFALNSVNVVASILTGDLKLVFNCVEPKVLLGFFIFVMVQSGAEELVNRFYIYQKLRRRYKHPAVAIIGNAALFLVLHLKNANINIPSLIELFLWGVFFSLVILYFDNLWVSIAIHTAWNFTQNIIYGLPNSGHASSYSIYKIEAASDGFFFDTGFGVEGSWGAVIVLCIAIAVLILKYRNKEANDLWDGWVDPEKEKKKAVMGATP